MAAFVQRAHPRQALQVPIKYRPAQSNHFIGARTLNYSNDGLCLEVNQKVEPETEIYVVMENYTPGQAGPEGYRSYLTSVRWVRPLAAQRNQGFVAGTQIMARSHDTPEVPVDEPRQICDLCGDLIQECQLHCTDENAQLCAPCYHHYCKIPKGKTRECVDRFIVGNVV